MTSVPVTDAFDDSDMLKRLEVELTPDQIEWLEQMAAERGVSLGHILRTIITAQMRRTDDASPSKRSESEPHSASATEQSDDDSPLLDHLRSPQEQTHASSGEHEAVEPSDGGDGSDARIPDPRVPSLSSGPATAERRSDPVPDSHGTRSMFDMVE